MRGWLPDEILDRPKQGFTVPLSSWLRGELRSGRATSCSTATRSTAATSSPPPCGACSIATTSGADGENKRIWSLLMLELWHREFVDAPVAPALRAAA